MTGLLRPTIIVPESVLAALSPAQMRYIFLHELVHARRLDVLWHWLMLAARTLHWFNPAVWLASSRIRSDRELACDAAVLGIVGAGQNNAYGQTVLAVVERLAPVPLAATVGLFEARHNLKRRIAMIAQYKRPSRLWSAVACGLLLVLVVAGLTSARARQPLVAERRPLSSSDLERPGPTIDRNQVAALAGNLPNVDAHERITISGRCVDEDGNPLTNAEVLLFEHRQPEFEHAEVGRTNTDADGGFHFADLPSPVSDRETRTSLEYYVVARHKGRSTTVWRLTAERPQPESRTMTLVPAASLRGRVTDDSGRPIVGAVVWVGSIGLNPVEGIRSDRTDAGGHYEIDDLFAWKAEESKSYDPTTKTTTQTTACYFRVRHPDYGTVLASYDQLPKTVDVVLRPAGLIEGRVIDKVTGRPAAGVFVSAQGIDQHGDAQERTDAEGRYRLTLVADRYNVWATAAGRTGRALDSFAVQSGEAYAAPDLELIEGSIIEGRIIDAQTDEPITRGDRSGPVMIGLYGPARPKSGAACESAAVDDEGRFRLRVVPGLNYPYIMSGDLWKRTDRNAEYRNGIEVGENEVVSVVFRVLKDPPPADQSAPVRLPLPVGQEREAAAAVRRLGGWYELDETGHVIEVNMVYHQTADGRRYDNQNFSADALPSIARFPKLRRLLLKSTQANDDALRHIVELTELRRILIWDGREVSDRGVAHMQGLENLEFLHLSHAAITDEALRILSGLPRLERLSLQGNDFTDRGLQYVSSMRQLKSLVIGLGHGTITDAGLVHLENLTNLERLGLQRTAITDAGMPHIARLKKLKTLWLGSTGVTAASLPMLEELTELQSLNLPGSLRDEARDRLERRMPNLREVH